MLAIYLSDLHENLRDPSSDTKEKWLEELVSQSNTIQAQEDIGVQGRLQARSG